MTSSADPSSNRTEVAIEYEYQLEVNKTESTGTIEDVLGNLDSTILRNLQDSLPNGQTTEDDELPNVTYTDVSSDVFSACFTKSEQCNLVKSKISISYEGTKPPHSVEFVSLRLVQGFLKNFASMNNNVIVNYAYPLMVESLAQFQMDTVQERMSDVEIQVLEETFVEVFGAIVFAIEGDTDIVDAIFVYQDLIRQRRNLSPDNSTTSSTANIPLIEEDEDESVNREYTLSTDMKISGFCRDCTSSQFGDIVNGVIINNINAFQNKLKTNAMDVDTVYFTNVTSTSFAVPQLPDELPPIQDKSIFDNEPPETESKVPWFLIFGIVVASLIVIAGVFMIRREESIGDKEEFSTSDDNSGEEGESYDEEGDYTQEEFTQEDYTNAGETMTQGDGYTLDDYQVETIAENDDPEGQYEEGEENYGDGY